MLNFLYCCDENYNKQLQTSLFSLLDNISESINIYVIYKKGFNRKSISEKINQHNKLNNISFIEFNSDVDEFPNVKDSHVSEATYYRLFLDQHIEDDLDFLIYLDADIVCISDPLMDLAHHIRGLKKEKLIVSVTTEHSVTDGRERLGMQSNNYFNAGVMIINYKQWIDKKIGNQLRMKLKSNKKILNFWDQDILNMFFDGNYYDLNHELNSKVSMDVDEKIKNDRYMNDYFKNKKLLHFQGKFKPWSLKGILNKKSRPYQEYYEIISNGDIHLQFNWKGNVIKDLVISVLTLDIFSYKKPFRLLVKVIKSLFRKNEKY